MQMASGGLPSEILAYASGTETISADTNGGIPIIHNLGYYPDYICLYVENMDYDLIPGGSCVRVAHVRNGYDKTPNEQQNGYHYLYAYKHSTSHNLLHGQSVSTGLQVTTETATVIRGSQPWRALDVNGDPIVYRWFAIKFKEG